MFSVNYVNYCAKKRKAVTTAAVEMGFSRAIGQKWADGTSIPRRATLLRIADYFGCTVDDLLADNEKSPPLERDGLSEAHQRLLEIIDGASDDDLAKIADLAEIVLRGKQDGNKNP